MRSRILFAIVMIALVVSCSKKEDDPGPDKTGTLEDPNLGKILEGTWYFEEYYSDRGVIDEGTMDCSMGVEYGYIKGGRVDIRSNGTYYKTSLCSGNAFDDGQWVVDLQTVDGYPRLSILYHNWSEFSKPDNNHLILINNKDTFFGGSSYHELRLKK